MPWFVGAAEMVTDVPVQTGLADADTVMLTGKFGITVICCWMLVAGLLDVQGSEEVRIQMTISLLFGG